MPADLKALGRHVGFYLMIGASFASLVASSTAFGQASPPAAAPAYQTLRFDEDWSYLKDKSKRRDYWDVLKYIGLNKEGWYVSLGGEARLRYEHFTNSGFGSGPQTPAGYLLQRYLFHADFHFGDHVRFFTQVQSGIENGRNGGPRATDMDKLEFHQAFVDFKASSDAKHFVTFRLGRQEFEFGSGRLFSASEVLNVRRSFDGFRITGQAGAWTFHAVAAKPLETNVGILDDVPDHTQTVWGVGAVHPIPGLGGGNASLYYIGYSRRLGRFDSGSGQELRHTLGSRIFGKKGGLDYNYEFVYQGGSFGPRSIRAWAVATDSTYALGRMPWTPTPGLRFDAASGNKNANTDHLGDFNPLFPGTAYSGKIGLLGPTNIIDLTPTFKLKPYKHLTLTGEWGVFWRQSIDDGIYGIAVNLFKPGRPSRARYIANQPDLQVQCPVNRHFTLVAIFTQFRAGRFIEETPPSKTVGYVTLYGTYRF